MTDASSNPYITGLIALVTAPVVLTAIQSAVKRWYDRRNAVDNYKIIYNSANIPQQLTIPAPPFKIKHEPPLKWTDRSYRRRYWTILRVVYSSLTAFYLVAGTLGIVIFVRKSPVVLVAAIPALMFSAYTFREFLRIGRQAWDQDFTMQAEVTVNGTKSDVTAAALSAVSGIRGRLVTVNSTTGQVIVDPDRKVRLEISIEEVDMTSVRVCAFMKPVNPAKVQSRLSAYRQLYAFMENFLAQYNNESGQLVAANATQHRLIKWPLKRASSS